jgi:hypothetical protein
MWAVALWIIVGLFLFIKIGVSIPAAILGGGIVVCIVDLVCLCVMVFDGVS